MDRAHIRSKGAGGTWGDENIMLLCRNHHIEQHALGWFKFCEKYRRAEEALEKRGWVISDEFGRKKLIRKED
jgi:hypothetical protein